MSKILNKYLNEIQKIDNYENELESFLSNYSKTIYYTSNKDLSIGLLRYKNPPNSNTAFIFQFPNEEILEFHTMNMKFNIDIYFFNSKGKLVNSKLNVMPNIKLISSKVPALYAVEVVTNENRNR